MQEEREEAGTFGELAVLYLKDHAKPGKKSWKDDRRTINAELLAKNRANWRHVKVCELKRKMIRDMFRAITDRGAPVMANRTLALVSTMLNYALVELEWIEANPAARLKKNKEKARARVLSDEEIRELWAAIHETKRVNEHNQRIARLNATLNDAFKMRFYTVQRGAEVFQMRWSDLDLDGGWWEILNHVDRGARATKVYDRYEYDREKRDGLETWAKRLEAILAAKAPSQGDQPNKAAVSSPARIVITTGKKSKNSRRGDVLNVSDAAVTGRRSSDLALAGGSAA